MFATKRIYVDYTIISSICRRLSLNRCKKKTRNIVNERKIVLKRSHNITDSIWLPPWNCQKKNGLRSRISWRLLFVDCRKIAPRNLFFSTYSDAFSHKAIEKKYYELTLKIVCRSTDFIRFANFLLCVCMCVIEEPTSIVFIIE